MSSLYSNLSVMTKRFPRGCAPTLKPQLVILISAEVQPCMRPARLKTQPTRRSEAGKYGDKFQL